MAQKGPLRERYEAHFREKFWTSKLRERRFQRHAAVCVWGVPFLMMNIMTFVDRPRPVDGWDLLGLALASVPFALMALALVWAYRRLYDQYRTQMERVNEWRLGHPE